MTESPAARGATVVFERVTKRYPVRGGATAPGDRSGPTPAAVNDLSFEVPAGRICVIVGPSGCGKTTSLKMVNRLIEPTSGRILLDGSDIAKRDLIDLRRGIGYVIQHVGLFPHQTVLENVGVVLRLLDWPENRRAARSAELLALVGLDPGRYGRRYPTELSGGERQRVGVARALAADPPLMLMDEPFGAVDPIVRGHLQDEFLRLQRDLAKTILFVTHDIDEAIKMGDVVAILETTPDGGRLAQFGKPSDILATPASPFVAQFVGTDRGLKRLALLRVADIELRPAVTARAGESAAEALVRLSEQRQHSLLLVDEANRPIGWVGVGALRAADRLTAGMGIPMSPLLSLEATLKDALSQLIESDVQTGIAVDSQGTVLGLIPLEGITDRLHAPDEGTPA